MTVYARYSLANISFFPDSIIGGVTKMPPFRIAMGLNPDTEESGENFASALVS